MCTSYVNFCRDITGLRRRPGFLDKLRDHGHKLVVKQYRPNTGDKSVQYRDGNAITLVVFDQPGLEVRSNSGNWHKAVLPNGMAHRVVCFPGNALARESKKYYKATCHRVHTHGRIKRNSQQCFYNGSMKDDRSQAVECQRGIGVVIFKVEQL